MSYGIVQKCPGALGSGGHGRTEGEGVNEGIKSFCGEREGKEKMTMSWVLQFGHFNINAALDLASHLTRSQHISLSSLINFWD